MKILAFFFRHLLIYLVICGGTFLMLRLILQYTSFRTDVGFLVFKQDYLDNKVWKFSFYMHVFTSIFALLAVFTQFSAEILKGKRWLHKLMGRLYAWDILLINFPAGMVMAIYANGLWPSKIAFVILDCLWFWFTYKGVMAARKKNFVAHRHYMIRSYALTFSAITLRSWKLILSNTFTIDPLSLYMIDAWLGFVPNLLVAEWIILREKRRKMKKTSAPTRSWIIPDTLR